MNTRCYYPSLGLLAVGSMVIKCNAAANGFFNLHWSPTVQPMRIDVVSVGSFTHLYATAVDGSFLIARFISTNRPHTSICIIQRLWRERARLRWLAVAMAWHPRLGAESTLRNVLVDCAQLIIKQNGAIAPLFLTREWSENK